jgi:hypothetical protein
MCQEPFRSAGVPTREGVRRPPGSHRTRCAPSPPRGSRADQVRLFLVHAHRCDQGTAELRGIKSIAHFQ